MPEAVSRILDGCLESWGQVVEQVWKGALRDAADQGSSAAPSISRTKIDEFLENNDDINKAAGEKR